MTTINLRRQTRTAVDQSVLDGQVPRAPRSGIGLVLPGSGRTRKVLVDQAGKLTAAGDHYYKSTNQQAPRQFDFAQQPERKGRSLFIRMLDGTQKAISRYDAVERSFKPTALGKRFLANRKDSYTVLFPSRVDLTRKNGSIYTREGDHFPSTASDLGQIQVSAALSESDQINEVRRQANAWLEQQPTVDGEKILLAGYETNRLDSSRGLEFNRLHYNSTGDPEAIMHRPLTAGRPYLHGFRGVCEEASEDTNDTCVPHQLSKVSWLPQFSVV